MRICVSGWVGVVVVWIRARCGRKWIVQTRVYSGGKGRLWRRGRWRAREKNGPQWDRGRDNKRDGEPFWSRITDYWALMETAICRKRSKTARVAHGDRRPDSGRRWELLQGVKKDLSEGGPSVGWTTVPGEGRENGRKRINGG